MDSPLIKATVQATLLGATSNILAQAITAYQRNESFSLQTVPVLQFMLFSILNTPPNYLWQQWLEEAFPGSQSPPSPKATSIQNEKRKPPSEEIRKPPQRSNANINVRNTAIKFLLDQTLGALVNTVLFVAGMAAIKGLRGDQIITAVNNDTLPIMLAGMKLWPLVSLISFSMIPVQKRVVFGSIVGVVWGIYLCLITAA